MMIFDTVYFTQTCVVLLKLSKTVELNKTLNLLDDVTNQIPGEFFWLLGCMERVCIYMFNFSEKSECKPDIMAYNGIVAQTI